MHQSRNQVSKDLGVDPKPQIGIIVTMIISARVQGVSPFKLPGQGRHAHEPLVPAQLIRKDVQKKSWPCVPHRHLHCTIRRTMATKTKCRIEINPKRLEQQVVLVKLRLIIIAAYQSILTSGKGASRCRSPTCQDSWWFDLKMLSRKKRQLTKLILTCSDVQPGHVLVDRVAGVLGQERQGSSLGGK